MWAGFYWYGSSNTIPGGDSSDSTVTGPQGRGGMPFDWPPKAPRVEGDREKQTGGWWFSLFFAVSFRARSACPQAEQSNGSDLFESPDSSASLRLCGPVTVESSESPWHVRLGCLRLVDPHRHGQRESEGAAAAGFAVRPELATVCFDDALADEETQARALVRAL